MKAFKHKTREKWLLEAIEILKPRFDGRGHPLPPCKVSLGWPKSRRARGEAWSPELNEKNGSHWQIFISPHEEDPAEILAILLHELCHAALPPGTGHRKPFKDLARKIGLIGPATATVAGEKLEAELKEIADQLGAFPHERLTPPTNKKQTTRLIKLECPKCGYIIRTTRAWLETGIPDCPCGGPFVPDDAAKEE